MCIFLNNSTRLEPLLIKALNECYLAHLMLIKVTLCDDNKTLEICFLLAIKIIDRCFYIGKSENILLIRQAITVLFHTATKHSRFSGDFSYQPVIKVFAAFFYLYSTQCFC